MVQPTTSTQPTTSPSAKLRGSSGSRWAAPNTSTSLPSTSTGTSPRRRNSHNSSSSERFVYENSDASMPSSFVNTGKTSPANNDPWAAWGSSTNAQKTGEDAFQHRVAATHQLQGNSPSQPSELCQASSSPRPPPAALRYQSRTFASIQRDLPPHMTQAAVSRSTSSTPPCERESTSNLLTSPKSEGKTAALAPNDGWGEWSPEETSTKDAGANAYRQRELLSQRVLSGTDGVIARSEQSAVQDPPQASSLLRSNSDSTSTSSSRVLNSSTKPHSTDAPAENMSPDPWAGWSPTSQAEAGGAEAFRARQRMGAGERTPMPTVTSSVPKAMSSTSSRSRTSGASRRRVQKANQLARQQQAKARATSTTFKNPSGSSGGVTVEPAIHPHSPIGGDNVKSSQTISQAGPKGLPPRPRTSLEPATVEASEAEPVRSRTFPAGSLLARIASSSLAHSPPDENQPASIAQAAVALQRVSAALDKVRTRVLDARAAEISQMRLKYEASTQTAEDEQADLLADQTWTLSTESGDLPKATSLADELAGLSFDTPSASQTIGSNFPKLSISSKPFLRSSARRRQCKPHPC